MKFTFTYNLIHVCVYVRLYTLLYHAKLKPFLQRGIQKILNNNTTFVQNSIIKCDCKLFYAGKVNLLLCTKTRRGQILNSKPEL